MQFRDRLHKTARNMLDTYTREQGTKKADHIASLMLECTYVRTVLPPTSHLAKMYRNELPTGDERLTSLSRCLQWLRSAEVEMLSFSGQPALRVMLCRERVACLMDMFNRLSEHLVDEKGHRAKRRLDLGDGEDFCPLVDTMINDLRQYGHFIGFLRTYSPAAKFVIDEWVQDRRDLLATVKTNVSLWRAKESGSYNKALQALEDMT